MSATVEASVVVAGASWPESDVDTVTPVTGFVVSTFNPLVAEVANRCLSGYDGEIVPERTAIVLASVNGDVTSVDAVAEAVATGARVAPLLFFQSNPNAVLGHIAARWGLAGPVVCTSPTGDPMADAVVCAELLFAAGEADAALVITAEVAGGSDRAEAVLVMARERA
ncbi:hypothetical protein [Actinokineospora globicatena]|uniref:Beta-ketoacyl synthase, N-terminal domain n=1 Tax=Actinokineospora globicatena TaxID=103729 RepID=A0A9W6QIR7_9PSEU|nr:hypothetical protein [Actinokineospora globicatena]GLW89347.1 hypothetical protein Aglo03_01630 [Actinokineospora globicatena]